MSLIYFDVTDIVHYASRYSRLTGIQRVQLCITNILSRKYGGDVIRCVYYDYLRKGMYEYDPNERLAGSELDPEVLLLELGLLSPSAIFPTKAQVKSYLRRYSSKPVRALKKADVYLSAFLFPARLKALGLEVRGRESGAYDRITVSGLDVLPDDSCYVCMGSSWLHPKVGDFARSHYINGGKFVQLIHDLIPVSHPQYFTAKELNDFSTWLMASFEYTSAFIAVSRWTAKALGEYARQHGYDVNASAVALAHEFMGFDRGVPVPAQPEILSFESRGFVLCVGTIEHRKNCIALLKTWELLIDELGGLVPRLVFAGKYGRGGVDFEKYLESSYKLAGHVTVMHAVSDEGLAWLYSNCLFTAMPSLTEGWGLPIGESAWFGKVCVTSNVTSMPEVCGSLAEYVDPNDMASMVSCFRNLISNRDYLKMRELEIAAVELRVWADVANEIYKVCLLPERDDFS